jgi:hypothetical protein
VWWKPHAPFGLEVAGKGPAQQAPRPRPTSTLRYGLSYRDVEELLAERDITVDHVTIYR